MGLIKCPDCGKEYSDRIEACPKCFCPIEEAIKVNGIDKKKQSKKVPKEETKENIEEIMSFKEAKTFAFNSIKSLILKELDNKYYVISGDDESDDVDYYLESSEGIIGLDIHLDVAPCSKSYIYNSKHAKKMSDSGYKYAIAKVGIGSSDPIRFDLRKVYKNDGFLFDYEKLRYFNYKELSQVRYSMSLSKENYDFIYEREKENTNPYTVTKPIPNFINEYGKEDFNNEIKKYWRLYSFKENNLDLYIDYLYKLGISINYRLKIKELLLNFMNALSLCRGKLFSDSVPALKHDIISICYEFLDDNKLINLTKYDKYVFSYYVYNCLTNQKFNKEIKDIEKDKINLFNNRPDYFGFKALSDDKLENKINCNEYIFNCLESMIDFANNNYKKFVEINLYINNQGATKTIDFAKVSSIYNELLKDSKEKYNYISKYIDVTATFKNQKYIVKYKHLLEMYIELLQLDVNINHKLSNKSKGGRYGFFEYKKESKKRNELCNNFVATMENFINNFSVKKLTKNTYVLIDACKHLSIELKNKYINDIKHNPDKLADFRVELCKFFDYVLTLPVDEDAKEFKDGVSFAITNFIELIELLETNDSDENLIYENEYDLMIDLNIIRDKIFEIQI